MFPIALLAQLVLPPSFALLQRPGATALNGSEIATVCDVPPDLTVPNLLKLEQRVSDSVLSRGTRTLTWVHLGCIRAELSLADAINREGPLHALGVSWGQGAINALLKGLDADSLNSTALSVLALVAMHERFTRSLPQVTARLRNAVEHGTYSSGILRGCTYGAAHLGDSALVRRCASTALAVGLDSTWHLLEWARQRFNAADTVLGQSYFYAAVGAAHDSASKAEVSWHLQWFLSPGEVRGWVRSSDSVMAHQVRDWIMQRDVRDGEPLGSRLAEHFKRLAVVEREYVIEPAKMLAKSSLSGPPAGWGHQGGTQIEDGGTSVLRDYQRWQNDFDDRGVVYMRFGPPQFRSVFRHIEKIVTRRVGNKLVADTTWTPVEAWHYLIADVPLNLTFNGEDFDGSAGATTLRKGVNDPDHVMEGWSIGRDCRLLGMMQNECDKGDIAWATQTDDNALRPKRFLTIGAQVDRIWDPVTEMPIVLVGYAVHLGELQKSDSGGKHATVGVAVRQWDPTIDRWDDTSVTRTIALPPGAVGDVVAGVVALPSTRGTTTFGMVIQQKPDRWGNTVAYPWPLPSGNGVKMSDLILGAPSQNLVWAKGDDRITLAPLGYFYHEQNVEVYFQTMTAERLADAIVTIAIVRAADVQNPALQIQLTEDFEPGLRTFKRLMNITRLEKGTYTVLISLANKAGVVLVRQQRQMVIK